MKVSPQYRVGPYLLFRIFGSQFSKYHESFLVSRDSVISIRIQKQIPRNFSEMSPGIRKKGQVSRGALVYEYDFGDGWELALASNDGNLHPYMITA
jgi:hypothetical protein